VAARQGVLRICAVHLGAGHLPRIRYDQLMGFSWKVLLPLAFANLMATAVLTVYFS
jgi:NADH:ubiquinone oxidoreductase subunit H